MTIQTEAQRQFYLGMAGIHCWYARSPQPGAAASPAFDFGEPEAATPEVEAPPQLPSMRPDKRGQRKAGIAGVRGLMTDTAQADKATPVPAALPAEKTAPAAVTEPLAAAEPASAPQAEAAVGAVPEAFADNHRVTANWGFWQAGDWLLVSALSPDASHQLQESLARNVLRALGAEAESEARVQWPVFNNPAVPGNDRAGLQALLRDLRQRWPDQKLIALGLCQGSEWSGRSQWLADALGEPTVDFEHSLPALATDPGRKRALWSRLRPLVAGSD